MLRVSRYSRVKSNLKLPSKCKSSLMRRFLGIVAISVGDIFPFAFNIGFVR